MTREELLLQAFEMGESDSMLAVHVVTHADPRDEFVDDEPVSVESLGEILFRLGLA